MKRLILALALALALGTAACGPSVPGAPYWTPSNDSGSESGSSSDNSGE